MLPLPILPSRFEVLQSSLCSPSVLRLFYTWTAFGSDAFLLPLLSHVWDYQLYGPAIEIVFYLSCLQLLQVARRKCWLWGFKHCPLVSVFELTTSLGLDFFLVKMEHWSHKIIVSVKQNNKGLHMFSKFWFSFTLHLSPCQLIFYIAPGVIFLQSICMLIYLA